MKHIFAYILLCFCTLGLRAQLLNEIFSEDRCIDSLEERSLRLEVDAAAFFHDNEYQSEVQNGYTLPGARLTPHLAYNPIRQINIEAGASMLFYNGANRYPNFAYHDIAIWKGNQYQHGTHVVPWLRLQASFKNLDIIAGNIYGGGNHGLITPLFNPEQNLSTDPEMGVQFLWNLPRFQLDTWLNWQSYIFETDTHQEAFTVGTTAKILWTKKSKRPHASKTHQLESETPLSFYTPIQLIIQHRGGEQNETSYGVQTLCNASVGFGVRWKCLKKLDYLDAQTNAIASYQESGKLWPFNTGFAWHTGITSRWIDHINLSLDYLYTPKQFVSLFGNPFYSTISLKHGGTQINADNTLSSNYKHQYHGMHNIRVGIDYHHTFAKAYTVGAAGELFSIHSKECMNQDESTHDGSRNLHEMNLSFGIYFRVSPSFILKQFK